MRNAHTPVVRFFPDGGSRLGPVSAPHAEVNAI